MDKLNYSIRCTRDQKGKIQRFASKTGLTIIDSVLLAIEHYNKTNNLDDMNTRIKELEAQIQNANSEVNRVRDTIDEIRNR